MRDISSIVNGPLFFNAAMIFSSVRIDGPGDSMVAFTATSLRSGQQHPCEVNGRVIQNDLIPARIGVKNYVNSRSSTRTIMAVLSVMGKWERASLCEG